MNPNTGAPMEKNQCAVELIPLLLIENSQQQRSTSAAVESFRNETLQKSETTNHLLYHLAQQPALITPVQVSTLEAGKN